MTSRDRTRLSRWLFLLPLAGLVASLALVAAPIVPDRFGASHDGLNGAVFSSGSRAIRDDGWVASRLGAVHDADDVYANHPPLIYVETAAAEVIAGEHRWASRAPAWLGSLAVLALMGLILHELGCGRLAIGASLAITFSSGMFLVYGTMLDTPVVALPFALAFFLRTLQRPDGHWSIGVLALVACLAAWQSFVLVGVVAITDAIRGRRLVTGLSSWCAVGVLAGGVLDLAWQAWALGSLDEVVAVLGARTGVDGDAYAVPSSFGGMLRRQGEWLATLISPVAAVIAVVGVVVARATRMRLAILQTALTVVVYTVVMSRGAYFHDYWQYWILVPIGLAVGAAVDRWVADPPRVVTIALAAVLVGSTIAVLTPPRVRQVAGVDAGELVAEPVLADEPVLLLSHEFPRPPRWASYETHRPSGDVSWEIDDPGVRLIHRSELVDRYADREILRRQGSYVIVGPEP